MTPSSNLSDLIVTFISCLTIGIVLYHFIKSQNYKKFSALTCGLNSGLIGLATRLLFYRYGIYPTVFLCLVSVTFIMTLWNQGGTEDAEQSTKTPMEEGQKSP